MQEQYLGRIEPNMDVCDMDGDKVGTIVHVYRHELAAVAPDIGGAAAPYDSMLEVKTGFLGLGSHLFIPFRAIHDVTRGCVFLDRTREAVDSSDWNFKPPYLEELR